MNHIKNFNDNIRKSIASCYNNREEDTQGAYPLELFKSIWKEEFYTARNIELLRKSNPEQEVLDSINSLIEKSVIMPNGAIQKLFVEKDFITKSESELDEDFAKGEECAVLGKGEKSIYLFENKVEDKAE